ncbi:hypothetical protein ACET3Z_028819 [Daucus carota]
MSEQSHQITAQKEYLEHLHVPKKSWKEITKRHKKREKPGQQEQLVHTRLLQHLLVIVLQVPQHLQNSESYGRFSGCQCCCNVMVLVLVASHVAAQAEAPRPAPGPVASASPLYLPDAIAAMAAIFVSLF